MGYVVALDGTSGGAVTANNTTIEAASQGFELKLRIKGSDLQGTNATKAVVTVGDGTYAGRKFYINYIKGTGATSKFNVVWSVSLGGNNSTSVFDASTLDPNAYYTLFFRKNNSFTSGDRKELSLIADDGTVISTYLNSTSQSGFPTTAGTGIIQIGVQPSGGPNAALAMTVDGFALYIQSGNVAQTGASRYAAPTAGDSAIVSAVTFDEGSGTSAANLVSGAGTWTLAGVTWTAGGTWNGTVASTTFYLTDVGASGSNHAALQQDGTAPADSPSSTGWIVAGVATSNFARMSYTTKRAASAFSTTAQPSGAPDNTLGDCFRIGPLTGSFPAGNWNFSFNVKAGDLGGNQDGRVNVRVWRSTSATGASATEITSGATALSAVTDLSTSVAQASSGTIALGAVTLTNEYLFIQVAWEVTGAA